jgi:histidine decarboxylase
MHVLRCLLAASVAVSTLSYAAEPHTVSPARSSSTTRPSFEIPTATIVAGAVGPFARHSDGYGNPGASGLGYLSVLTLSTGKAKKDLNRPINNILPFDEAEAGIGDKGGNTYIGQINLLQASSFSGPNGLVWGYHLAEAEARPSKTPTPLFHQNAPDGSQIPVYDLAPLLDAGRRLFGTRDHPRYPMLPGSHIIAAYKDHTAEGPATVWCVLGVAMSSEPAANANLFMEACDEVKGDSPVPDAFAEGVLKDLAKSMVRVGENQRVTYKEIFLGYKSEFVPTGMVGTALAAVPYIVLAKQAVPKGGPTKLLKMSIAQWEQERGLTPLPPLEQRR